MRRDHPTRFGFLRFCCRYPSRWRTGRNRLRFDVLRLDGVGLFSSVNERYLGDPSFDPVFDELNRRKALRLFTRLTAKLRAYRLAARAFVRRICFSTRRVAIVI